jgi:prepilin-type N-terminal cleavage/methylation domain-containing protein
VKRAIGNRAGFTMLEMMVTLAVFSTLVAMTVPRYRDFQRAMTMKAVARNLATNFRLAQQRASSTNRTCYVDLDTANRAFTVWLDQDRDKVFDGLAEVKASGFAYEGTVGGVPAVTLPTELKIESATWAKGIRNLPSVAFLPDGSVAAPGEVVIADTKSRKYRVGVGLAGAVTIEQSIKGSWVE